MVFLILCNLRNKPHIKFFICDLWDSSSSSSFFTRCSRSLTGDLSLDLSSRRTVYAMYTDALQHYLKPSIGITHNLRNFLHKTDSSGFGTNQRHDRHITYLDISVSVCRFIFCVSGRLAAMAEIANKWLWINFALFHGRLLRSIKLFENFFAPKWIPCLWPWVYIVEESLSKVLIFARTFFPRTPTIRWVFSLSPYSSDQYSSHTAYDIR